MNSLRTLCLICQFHEKLCDLTSQENEETAKKLADVTTIQIVADDSPPRCICQECIELLDVTYNFLQRCKVAEQRLQEELHQESVEYQEEMESTISSIKNEPLETTEDEQLLHENVPGKYVIEEDLSEGEIDLDEDRKDIVIEEAKLAEPPAGEEKDQKFYRKTRSSGVGKGSELNLKTRTKNRSKQIFNCQTCSKSFSTSSQLKRHKRSAHRKKAFGCDLCGKAFARNKHLVQHHSVHLEKRDYPFKCAICGKSFKLKGPLTIHLRSHTKELSYECNVCHKKFRHTSSLYRHRSSVHEDKWRYKCDLCNKTFWRRCDLKAHQVVHSGERPFECTICGKTFGFRENLNCHRRTHDEPTTAQEKSNIAEEQESSEG